MVYGAVFCPINSTENLVKIGCADSKTLSEAARDIIFNSLCEQSNKIGWCVDIISSTNICNNMLKRRKCSLNEVSVKSAVKLIKMAESNGINIQHIYVDTVGKPETYQSYLLSLFPQYTITVAKKADSIYPIVSAASICAKVTRDHALSVWKFQEGSNFGESNFGSGYPGGKIFFYILNLP